MTDDGAPAGQTMTLQYPALIACLCLTVAFGGRCHAASAYKCTVGGEVIYQQLACDASSETESTVEFEPTQEELRQRDAAREERKRNERIAAQRAEKQKREREATAEQEAVEREKFEIWQIDCNKFSRSTYHPYCIAAERNQIKV